jgi:hypothetical protein
MLKPTVGPEERRMAAVHRLRSLQFELERMGATAAGDGEVLIWPGYRETLHTLLDTLDWAGVDVSAFGPGGEAEIDRNPRSFSDKQRISLRALLADVRRIRERVDVGDE